MHDHHPKENEMRGAERERERESDTRGKKKNGEEDEEIYRFLVLLL